MLIIDKEDIAKYRYAIAKYVFLKIYQDCHLVEDYNETNCMLVDRHGTKVIIAMLRKPFGIQTDEYEIVVFKKNSSKDYSKLSPEFNKLFDSYLIKALLSPAILFNEFKESPLFSYLLVDMISVHPVEGNVFKHYSNELLTNDKYGKTLGNIAFVNPDKCNDPFDCKCIYPSSSITDKFRIFCTTPIHNNILMWSHYSSEHKGYCFEYSKFNIVSAMIDSKIDGLGIIGEISYTNKRPKTRPIKKKVSYTDLKYYIDATFTKYHGWSYEKEYRFVMISDSFNSSNPFVSLSVPIINIFVGCKGSPASLVDSTGKILTPIQLHESSIDYSLK